MRAGQSSPDDGGGGWSTVFAHVAVVVSFVSCRAARAAPGPARVPAACAWPPAEYFMYATSASMSSSLMPEMCGIRIDIGGASFLPSRRVPLRSACLICVGAVAAEAGLGIAADVARVLPRWRNFQSSIYAYLPCRRFRLPRKIPAPPPFSARRRGLCGSPHRQAACGIARRSDPPPASADARRGACRPSAGQDPVASQPVPKAQPRVPAMALPARMRRLRPAWSTQWQMQ